MANHDFEDLFDPKEQEEIVRIAARLQSEDADRIGVRQIERAAEEAGIEARYVRAATAQVIAQRTQSRRSHEGGPASFFLALFILTQVAAIFNLMYVFAPGMGGSPLTGLAVVLALLMGAATSKRSGAVGAIQTVLATSILFGLVCGLVVRAFHGQVESTWWPTLPQLVLLEFGAALLGSFFGRFATSSRKQTEVSSAG